MTTINTKKILPSLFDRLIIDQPISSADTNKNSGQLIRELKESVRRDLENLLNTRCSITSIPTDLKESNNSLLNYGLPDLSTLNFLDDETALGFCRHLEKTIRRFEPRFKTINISLQKSVDNTDRYIRFMIDAILYAEPAPEVIAFDSVLEPVTRSLAVSEAYTNWHNESDGQPSSSQ